MALGAVHVQSQPSIRFVQVDSQTIEVRVDGQLFTVWHAGGVLNKVRLTRPVLWPILSPRGAHVTRCWPLGTCDREEPTDHSHHQGLWVAYGRIVVGDSDAVDTWAVYRPLPGGPVSKTRYRPGRRGVVVCRSTTVDSTRSEIRALCEWRFEDSGAPFLQEDRTMRFSAGSRWRAIDFVLRLRALDSPVRFADSKEGFLALRVGPDLQETRGASPEEAGTRPRLARYFNAYGGQGEPEVWGRRSPWMALQGVLEDDEKFTILFMDHPDNVNHPATWMSRGYGLFAVNPFGLADFTRGKQRFDFLLPAGGSVTFKYRVLFWSGHLSPEQAVSLFREYSASQPTWWKWQGKAHHNR